MLRYSLTRSIRVKAYVPSTLASNISPRYASSDSSEPKGNATGLAPGTADGMKPGTDNVGKEPAHPTPNVEGGEGPDAHPAKRPAPQPEPTRSTGIKGKEEMG